MKHFVEKMVSSSIESLGSGGIHYIGTSLEEHDGGDVGVATSPTPSHGLIKAQPALHQNIP